MKRSLAIAAALSATLIVTALPGVATAQDELEVTPEGVNWTLLTYAADGAATDVPAGVDATLFMDEGEVSGNGGCNTFFGTYELDGESLSFAGDMGMTLALCAEPAQSVEDGSMPLLTEVASWAIDSNILSLADGSGAVVLTYEEPVIDVTETDIVALDTALAGLDARISSVGETMRSHRIPALHNRVKAVQAHVDALDETVSNQNVPGLRARVKANEAVLAELHKRQVNQRTRIRELQRRQNVIVQALLDAGIPVILPE